MEADLVQEKCIKQLALTVAKRLKFHSSLKKGDQSIVGNVIQNIGDIKPDQ